MSGLGYVLCSCGNKIVVVWCGKPSKTHCPRCGAQCDLNESTLMNYTEVHPYHKE